MFYSRSNVTVESSECLNIDPRLKNEKFALRLQIYFTRKKTQFLTKIFYAYWSFLWACFEVTQKPNQNPLSHWILVKGWKIPNLVNELKNTSLKKRGKHWNFAKTFSIILQTPLNSFQVCQKLISNLLSHGILFKVL